MFQQPKNNDGQLKKQQQLASVKTLTSVKIKRLHHKNQILLHGKDLGSDRGCIKSSSVTRDYTKINQKIVSCLHPNTIETQDHGETGKH